MNSRTGIIKAFLVCTLLAAAAGPPALADYREDLAAAEQAYRMGDLNAVLYRLDRVVEDPDAPDDMRARALLDRAIFLSRQRARDRALKDYEKILARDPKNLDARINRARLLSQAGRLLEAIALLDQARFPRDKVCGEFISPAADAILSKLGVLDAIEAVNPIRLKGVALS
ncbi:MAG: tetratricopeptide repeat protein, partial [Rhodospirillales bacterium]|nr:tetratricopeptide repeat protein [Rhodospirillales bacterium]